MFTFLSFRSLLPDHTAGPSRRFSWEEYGDSPIGSTRPSRQLGSVGHFQRDRRGFTTSARIRRGDEGFGLMDVMVAFTILLIVVIPTVYLLSELAAQTSANSLSVTAGELAEQALENAGQIPLHGASGLLAALQGGPITTNPTVNGVTFTSVVNLSWSNIGSTKNLCTTGAPPQVILAAA